MSAARIVRWWRGPRARVALLLWLLSLPGVVAAAVLGVPVMLKGQPLPAPMATLMLAAGFQSALLLAAAAFGGALLAPSVGLHSPLLEALAGGPRPQRVGARAAAGAVGGLFGAGLLLALAQAAPAALEAARSAGAMPLPVRLLYGGISEEVLVRWGLMTGCLWGLWRVAQRGGGAPRTGLVAAAIVASALLFGAGHLPAAATWVPDVDAAVVAYVVLGNAAFGVVAGYLFWKHGLESAMLAHLAAHLLAYAAAG